MTIIHSHKIDFFRKINYNIKRRWRVNFMEKYYTCNKCKYTFCAEEGCEQCPDCGKHDVRPATEQEIADFKKHREEFKDNNKKY